MNKLIIPAISIKSIISIFITYLILFNGNAGSLIHYIGYFLVAGNYIIGLVSLVNITLLYIVMMHNLTFHNMLLKNLKYFLLIPDIVLVIINLLLGIYIGAVHNHMSLADAQSKFIILACGSAFVYYLISIILMLFISKTQKNMENISDSEIKNNNNPLAFSGKIGRKPYFITKFFILITCFMVNVIASAYQNTELFMILLQFSYFIFFAISLFAANKRLKDINWNPLLLIIWSIPFLGLTIGVPLFFVKTKQINK